MRKRGRQERRFMDVVMGDMKAVCVTEVDAKAGVKWRQEICCGEPYKTAAERQRRSFLFWNKIERLIFRPGVTGFNFFRGLTVEGLKLAQHELFRPANSTESMALTCKKTQRRWTKYHNILEKHPISRNDTLNTKHNI